jgi:probable DNA repair protein
MDSTLYTAAAAGHLILTVNDRLSRSLHEQYDLAQQRRGQKAWLRPDILSFSAWMARCQRVLPVAHHFLNKAQLERVWEMIVEADIMQSGNHLLQVPQTARRALQAHQLLVRYAADFDARTAAEDHRAFLRWRGTWQKLSAEKDWRDPAETPWLLADAIGRGTFELPELVIFAGFDETTPDQERLCAAIEGRGVTVMHWQPQPPVDVRQRRVAAQDPADEVSRCARWVRALLTSNPDARIGIVAPQLERYQPHIEQIFTAELEPSSLLDGGEVPLVFNLSLGQGLDKEGVVHAALRLLRTGFSLEQDEVSWLLHTPYLAGASAEADSRARLDHELRRLRRFAWPVARLHGLLGSLAKKHALAVSGLVRTVNKLAGSVRRSGQMAPGAWAEHFAVVLHDLGWPGARSLSSREYQAVRGLRDCLAEMASLDGVSAPIDRPAAVRLLSRMVAATAFQPESSVVPVQVLGELEAAGLTFDHLWVLGLTDNAMPRPARPNPFIPLALQKHCRMMHADAEREHHFASQVAARLFVAAPDVVMSWPQQDQGAPQRPSPFIADVEDELPVQHESCAPAGQIWASRIPLDMLVDDQAPPVPAGKPFTGGTAIIKDQALCPFRAFAHHRLRAERADTADIGIDNMSRGSLVHTVLELFWDVAKNHAALVSMDETDLCQLLDKAVEDALSRLERERHNDIPARLREIERQRLLALAGQWLTLERKRGPFRVAAAEKNVRIRVGELVIRTRIDRIDTLTDGSSAIIDYKTGQTDPLQWLEERITEPQLPIYALGMERGKLGAVMFAAVRGKEKERGFRGLARVVDDWPGARSRKLDSTLQEKGWSSFDEVIRHWEKALPELGDAFARGDAKVDPVDPDTACTYCDLKGLCRLAERRPVWQGAGHD